MKLCNRWDTASIEIRDEGLKGYINVRPMLVPRSSGRSVKTQFHKSKYTIVERLMNKMMGAGHKSRKHKISSGHQTGKSIKCYNIVLKTLERIEKKIKQNPIMVLVKAVENAAPREEITTIEYGGARYPKAVDSSPQRRVDFALRMMVQGSYQKSFNSKKKIDETLSEEIIKAYEMDQASVAIAKKLELERQADASR
ncbi:30S ribosomal protein S7 [Candidatus Woesearchaeota archaeon]|nr:30S ribosomal protein S7 [Candidatus Woesearchaeota archaeon]